MLYNEPTNAQLIDKLLYCSYMFRHYCVILTELVINTLPSYTSTRMCVNAVLVIQFKISHMYIPGQQNGSINIQTVYMATIQDFIRIVTTK
jgi:hypothetical protein